MLRGLGQNNNNLNTMINNINNKIADIEFELYDNKILYNSFCSDYVLNKSIKISKKISYILIECGYSHHFQTAYYYSMLMVSYVGGIPKVNVPLIHSYITGISYTELNASSKESASISYGTEVTLAYDGEDNDWYYYHLTSPNAMVDNLLRITGLKKKSLSL